MTDLKTHLSKKPIVPQKRFDEDYLKTWLEPLVREPVTNFEISALKGDASDRSYFRIRYSLKNKSAENLSIIAMQLKDSDPENIPDFNRMQHFLANLDMQVPEILHYEPERGLLFLNDGGDTHLEDITRKSPENIIPWYKKAIELIVAMQTRVTENMQPDCPAYSLRFDVEKLMWEMDFMVKHYVKGLLNCRLDKNEESNLRSTLQNVCKALAEEEPVFVHRDFHSRNLMIQKDDLLLIDFQDARMGPRQYDLVSLLKDSYVVLKEETRNELLNYYLQRMEEEGKPIPRIAFMKIFDLMSIQRNLKAIGTFAFQYMEHQNERYLQYVDPTLKYIRDTLHSNPDLEPLSQALKLAIPKLGPNASERIPSS